MKHAAIVCLVISMTIAVYVVTETMVSNEGIRAICRDGSVSKSKTNKGTCSRHGGVARWTMEE